MSEDLTQPIITESRKTPILPILFTILLVVLVSISGFLAYQNYQLQQKIAQNTTSSVPPTTVPTIIPTSVVDPTANWKTYKIVHDFQFGFSDYEIKLPESWKIQEHSSNFQNSETFTYTKPTSQTAGGDFTPGMAWLTINISESLISQIIESDENKKSESKALINGLEFTKLNGYGGVGESVYYSNFITSYKGKTYQISFSTQDEAIKAQILRDIDQILSTFKFVN